MTRLRAARRQDGGFTFVEVLVVIIILAILSLIAIATFLGQREKAERSRAVSSLRNAETFAVAIRSDREDFSECIDDYHQEAGENAPYTWKADSSAGQVLSGAPVPSDASLDANHISVFGPETTDPCDPQDDAGGWVSFAALAGEQCYYNLMLPGSDDRIRHRADARVPDQPSCEGSELQVTDVDTGALSFRGGSLAELSGW